MKKKIIKTMLVILILVLIVFTILMTSKVMIVKDILKKTDNLDSKKNIYIGKVYYTNNKSILLFENYIDRNSSKCLTIFSDVHFERINDLKTELTSYYYSDENGLKEYIKESGEITLVPDSSSELELQEPSSVNNEIKATDRTNNLIVDDIKACLDLKNIFQYSISSEKVRDTECYKITFNKQNEKTSDRSIIYIA